MEPKQGITIGLFGTCGGSTWREPFKEEYRRRGILFFDPQVDDWDPSMADIEAEHLADDEVILFPVLGETYGSGSLAEVGFSILQAVKLNARRTIIVYIERDLDEHLDDPVARKESQRARALVLAHLKKMDLDGPILVDNLDDMLQASLLAYEGAQLRDRLKQFNVLA